MQIKTKKENAKVIIVLGWNGMLNNCLPYKMSRS